MENQHAYLETISNNINIIFGEMALDFTDR